MPFQRAVDACFAHLGRAGTCTPSVGQTQEVRVIARRPDQIVGFGETAMFDLRVSEVATPRPGDRLAVDGTDNVVQSEPERRDPYRLIWTLDVRPV